MKHNWEYKPIGDCFAYIKNGANIKQEKEAGGLPVTRIETLSNGVFNRSKMGYANIFEIGKYEPNVLNNGDLLMSHINSKTYVGRTVIYESLPNEVIIHGMNLLRLIPNDAVRSKFFYYTTLSHYFKSKIVNIRKDSVNQSSFSISDLKKISIPVPPMEVQERIMAELDKINETIEDCRELLRNLDALSQSLFYDFFGDPITNPKKWQIKKIKEIGKVITGSTPSTKVEDYYNSHDICFVKPGDIDNSISYISDTKDYISNFAFDSCCRKLPMGTVVVTCIGIIGKVGILKVQANCNQQINAVIPFDAINNIYLAYILKEYAPLFTDAATGPVVKILNKSSFSEFSIPLPPLELQEKFAARIEQIEAQKKVLESTIAELQTLLDSRMDYWFN